MQGGVVQQYAAQSRVSSAMQGVQQCRARQRSAATATARPASGSCQAGALWEPNPAVQCLQTPLHNGPSSQLPCWAGQTQPPRRHQCLAGPAPIRTSGASSACCCGAAPGVHRCRQSMGGARQRSRRGLQNRHCMHLLFLVKSQEVCLVRTRLAGLRCSHSLDSNRWPHPRPCPGPSPVTAPAGPASTAAG